MLIKFEIDSKMYVEVRYISKYISYLSIPIFIPNFDIAVEFRYDATQKGSFKTRDYIYKRFP